jgi:hypothetical protein
LDKNLAEKRIFDRGRERLVAKVVPVTAELIQLQEETFGAVSSALKPETPSRQFLVALSTGDRGPVFIGDWRVVWQGLPASDMSEIRDLSEIESRYPFAYPFSKLYVFDFPVTAAQASTTPADFEIHSPYGTLTLPLKGVP